MAALRLLANKGLVGVTAKNLGRELGITDGAVFKHFPNKEAILEAAICTFEELLDHPMPSAKQPPLDRLRLFFLERVSRVRSHPEILGLAFNSRLEVAAGENGAARVRRIMARSVAFIRRCIREAQRDGTIRDTATPEVLGWMVLGVLRATATGRTGRTSPERVWDQLAATLT